MTSLNPQLRRDLEWHRERLLFEVSSCPRDCRCHVRDWEVLVVVCRLLGERFVAPARRVWWEE